MGAAASGPEPGGGALRGAPAPAQQPRPASRPAPRTSQLQEALAASLRAQRNGPAAQRGEGDGEHDAAPPLGVSTPAISATQRSAPAQPAQPAPRAAPTRSLRADAEWPPWLLHSAPEVCDGWSPRRLESFDRGPLIGQGTYSSVYTATDTLTGATVALKKVRVDTGDEEAITFAAREVAALRRVRHPNVLRLHCLAVGRDTSEAALYLILDYHPHDLAGALATLNGAPLPEAAAKGYVQQMLAGVAACHAAGVIHRDLKCSNLLLSDTGHLVLGDLGLAACLEAPHSDGCRARGTASVIGAPLTCRVITLWYRPPELLLGATKYGFEVDLWSAGCIAAELHTGAPLLPGRTEIEQVHRVWKLCGSVGAVSDGSAASLSLIPARPYPRLLSSFLADKGAPPAAVALCETLLAVRPSERGTASAALASAYFSTPPAPLPPAQMPSYPAGSHELAMRRRHTAENARRAAAARAAEQEKERFTRISADNRPPAAQPAPGARGGVMVSSLEGGIRGAAAHAGAHAGAVPPPEGAEGGAALYAPAVRQLSHRGSITNAPFAWG